MVYSKEIVAGKLDMRETIQPIYDEINKIYVLSQADGTSQRQPIDLEQGNVKSGNLIVTPSHLLIASPNELVGYALEPSEKDAQ